MEPGWITARQIEAARRTITHHLKRGGKVCIRIFPDKSVTAKPAETRMGSGKGAPDHWVAVVRARAASCSRSPASAQDLAKEALRLAGAQAAGRRRSSSSRRRIGADEGV